MYDSGSDGIQGLILRVTRLDQRLPESKTPGQTIFPRITASPKRFCIGDSGVRQTPNS